MSDVQSNVAPNTENVESTGILESVQHLATNVMDTAYEKMEAVKEGVISTIHTAEDAAIHMKDQVASTIISAEEKVLQAVHLTGEKAAETKDSAVSTAQTASNIASEKLTQASNVASEKLTQAKQMTGEQMEVLGAKATEIKKNTSDTAQSATNLASEKLTQASNVASEKLTQAKQMTGEQMEKLGVKASLAKDNAKDTVETAKNSDLLHTVTDTATAVSNSVVEEIQMLKNMATEKIHQVTEAGVYQTGLNLANQAVSTVSSGIETAKSTLSGFTHHASEVKEDIKEKVSEKMDQELKVMPTTEANVAETDSVPVSFSEISNFYHFLTVFLRQSLTKPELFQLLSKTQPMLVSQHLTKLLT